MTITLAYQPGQSLRLYSVVETTREVSYGVSMDVTATYVPASDLDFREAFWVAWREVIEWRMSLARP